MLHDGEGLLLGLKTLEDGGVVLAGENEFYSDAASYGSSLVGQPHLAHATLAEFSEKHIWANKFGFLRVCHLARQLVDERMLGEPIRFFVGGQQRINFRSE